MPCDQAQIHTLAESPVFVCIATVVLNELDGHQLHVDWCERSGPLAYIVMHLGSMSWMATSSMGFVRVWVSALSQYL